VIGGMGSILGAIVTGYMLGLAEGLTKVFYPEASNLVIVVIMAVTMVPLYFIWGRHLRAAAEDRERVMRVSEREAITDVRALKQSRAVRALVIRGLRPAGGGRTQRRTKPRLPPPGGALPRKTPPKGGTAAGPPPAGHAAPPSAAQRAGRVCCAAPTGG